MIDYNIISTGSKGNAVVLNDIILVDCGVSFKALKEVYKDLKIVLLTHIHSDHFNRTTLRLLSEARPTLRFACCEWLVTPLLETGVSKHSIDVLEIGKIYNYKAFKVSPVKLYHDVPNCGYRLFSAKKKPFMRQIQAHLQASPLRIMTFTWWKQTTRKRKSISG